MLGGYGIKGFVSFIDLLGRKFVYNKNSPEVRGVHRNISYNDPSIKKQRLDVILPLQEGVRPIVINIHGGGFVIGDKDDTLRTCKYFANKGFLVFNINYRLGPKYSFPTQLKDITKAINWIYENAPEYGGDINSIVIMGDSAGACLTSWYINALNNDELFMKIGEYSKLKIECIKAVCMYYGVYNFASVMNNTFFFRKPMVKYYIGKSKENERLASPINYVNENFPETFLCCGQKDSLYSQTEEFYNALNEKNVNIITHFPENATHGFIASDPTGEGDITLDMAYNFLKKTFEKYSYKV